MPWASDKIRMFYRAGLLGERMIGKELDDRLPGQNVWGRQEEANNPDLPIVEQFNFS